KPIILKRLDLMSFSAHKFNGPRGIGILYKKHNRVISHLLDGGGQEMGQRSTTENLAGIVATAKALRMALTEAKEVKAKENAMQEKLRAFLAQDRKSTRLNSSHVSISYAVFCLKTK